jgi:hypothetical protein
MMRAIGSFSVGRSIPVTKEATMAFARVVSFDDVAPERIAQLKQRIEQEERPENVPATEVMLLHDPDARRAVALLFFETEDDYRQGDAVMGAMPAEDTPGRRSSVAKYEVAIRRAASPSAM